MRRSLPNFDGRAFLAPMAGVSDPALRLLCRRWGASLVVTEFTNIHSIVAQDSILCSTGQSIRQFLEYSDLERPLSVQLFGSNIDVLAKAVRIVEPYFDIIDYNMGCPAPHITRQMAGAALLQHESVTREIFRTLAESTDKPITLKMRAGVTDTDRHLFLDIAGTAQDEGICMITLHPRTASQGYSGKSDWSLIRLLKDNVRIPVVGNGDITSPQDAVDMIRETGCDYIMIGRGAMGNPFLFRQINEYLKSGSYSTFTIHDRIQAFFEYLNMSTHYKIKLSSIKSQAMRFVKGVDGATRLRDMITAASSLGDLARVMKSAA
ncbi:MAG: tRNA-dihydrouridine synthase family protein [Cenarchaeum sp. SB0665_bin_23]|nr:tRNA-dihydrouridine synthase family protein [Cenarchaeum sp. SB0665_bin_23]MYG32842.1 tRNA-dihydrouridine synthase family protein [Cenarchaeum sp. SB0677_bin_16]